MSRHVNPTTQKETSFPRFVMQQSEGPAPGRTLSVPLRDGPISGLGGNGASLRILDTPFHGGRWLRVWLTTPAGETGKWRHPCLELEPPIAPRGLCCNGWQSWSESRLFRWGETMHPPRRIGRSLFAPYGDVRMAPYPNLPGHLHSWSWVWWPSAEGQLHLVASLDEARRYTRFDAGGPGKALRICRDENEKKTSSTEAEENLVFSLFMVHGDEPAVFSAWQRAWRETNGPEQGRPSPLVSGYTSWYRHYTRITPDKLQADLAALSSKTTDCFQIDDGWQTAVGDWTCHPKRFPDGLAAVVRAVKSRDMKAGLWLAPLVAERRSALVKNNPDWLERDARGKPCRAGFNPMWSGTFYALNPDHPGVQEYLDRVLERVFVDWGFDLVKLDFLYAAALQHSPTKNRAQRMHEALRRFRASAWAAEQKDGRRRWILGCGVPLASAAGLVDYCRVGADIHLAWEHRLLAWLRNRERVSTLLALRTVIGRRGIPGFGVDPDVLVLREGTRLSAEERHTILVVNALLGDLLFHSDDPSGYTLEIRAWHDRLHPRTKPNIERVDDDAGRIWIQARTATTTYQIAINLRAEAWKLPPSVWGLSGNEKQTQILAPHASRCWAASDGKNETKPADGMFPGFR